MRGTRAADAVSGVAVLLASGGLAACNTTSPTVTGSISGHAQPVLVSDAERDCLGRAMYFESNRTDEAGLLAVGTVVMNRIGSALFPGSICEVVGQRGQFAPGVLTKPMEQRDLGKIADAADAVLAGERHPDVGKAMYFHVATRRYHFPGMHYVAVAGGNAFYEKRKPERAGSRRIETAAAEPAGTEPERAEPAAAAPAAPGVPALTFAAAPVPASPIAEATAPRPAQ